MKPLPKDLLQLIDDERKIPNLSYCYEAISEILPYVDELFADDYAKAKAEGVEFLRKLVDMIASGGRDPMAVYLAAKKKL